MAGLLGAGATYLKAKQQLGGTVNEFNQGVQTALTSAQVTEVNEKAAQKAAFKSFQTWEGKKSIKTPTIVRFFRAGKRSWGVIVGDS